MKEYNVDELLCLIVLFFLGCFVVRYLLNCKCVEGVVPGGGKSARCRLGRCEHHNCNRNTGKCEKTPPGTPPEYKDLYECQDNCKATPSPSPSPSPSPPPRYWSCPGGNDKSKLKTHTSECILSNTYTRWSSKSDCEKWCNKPNPSPPPPAPSPPAPSPSPSPPAPVNECDTIVATKWKNLICDQKDRLEGNYFTGDEDPFVRNLREIALHTELKQKLKGIKNKEESIGLHPFSFDNADKPDVGCDLYDNNGFGNNYCIQVNQGTATCKPNYGAGKVSSAEKCEKYGTKSTCNDEGTGCIWRRPNLVDPVEELSVQPGTCPNYIDDETQKLMPFDLTEGGRCDANADLTKCYADPRSVRTLYGDLAVNDIIGSTYTELNNWCGDRTNPQPQVKSP